MLHNAQLLKQGAEAVRFGIQPLVNTQSFWWMDQRNEHLQKRSKTHTQLDPKFLFASPVDPIESVLGAVLPAPGHHQGAVRKGISTPNLGQEAYIQASHPGMGRMSNACVSWTL